MEKDGDMEDNCQTLCGHEQGDMKVEWDRIKHKRSERQVARPKMRSSRSDRSSTQQGTEVWELGKKEGGPDSYHHQDTPSH